jgi:glycerol kinase
MAGYIGSIDNGTSSTRFILFDIKGQMVASHQIETKQVYPQPGWVEHEPLDILQTALDCIEHTLSKSGVQASQVKAIGITNQRETTVVWDKVTGQPLHNAIVWLDTRTQDIVKRTIQQFGSADYFRASCGLPISTYFSAMKLKWLFENSTAVQEGVRSGTALFGTIETWLLWNLSGGARGVVHITDVSNASRTMLMNLKTQQWDLQTCEALDISTTVLPEIRSNSEVYAHIAVGSLQGVPISGCLGDQQAAMMGQMCFTPGSAKNTYGTGCFLLMNTGEIPVDSKFGLLTTICFKLGPNVPTLFALEGSIAVAGSLMKWLRDRLGLIAKTSEANTLMASVQDNGGVYFVPAFSGLLSPYWRDDARGVLVGLTHFAEKAHIVRAAYEATAYQTREVIEAMVQDSKVPLKELKVDGGMTVSQPLMEFQADILNIPVICAAMPEATAAGAAFAAGLAVGFWSSLEHLKTSVQQAEGAKVIQPSMTQENRERFYRGWKDAVQRSFNLASRL